VPVGRGHVLFPGHEQWSVSALRWNCPEVRDVFVVPEARRRGVSTAVMGALEQAVRDRGFSRIGLTVAQDEEAAPARALYDKLGYAFAHGPFIGSTAVATDEGPRPVGGVFVYLTKEL
jgi:GNAT superfamily N-acetyltransferase